MHVSGAGEAEASGRTECAAAFLEQISRKYTSSGTGWEY